MKSEYNFGSMNVLVVDHNKHMLTVVQTILQGFGVRNIRSALDAGEAFECLRSFAADLIVCEYLLTPVTGLEFVHMVRTAKDSRDPLIPMLMLTSHSEYDNVVAARDAGITEFVAKPVSPTVLYKHVIAIIEHPRQFVRSKKFFGPDRRRLTNGDFEGSDRRDKSQQPEDATEG
jgi:CheY-like chemotaxis protein